MEAFFMQKINSEEVKKIKNPTRVKNATKMLTYTAVLVALNVICNIFDVPLGIGDLKISLSYIPSMIAGMFLGAIPGLCVGLIGDVLGLLIMPQGAWIPLITLGSALMGLIPGLVFMIKKLNPYIKLAISLVLAFLICTCTVNSLGIFLMFMKGKKTFWAFFVARVPIQSIVFVINSVLLFLLYYPLQKFVFSKRIDIKKKDSTLTATVETEENQANEDIKNEDNVVSSTEYDQLVELKNADKKDDV